MDRETSASAVRPEAPADVMVRWNDFPRIARCVCFASCEAETVSPTFAVSRTPVPETPRVVEVAAGVDGTLEADVADELVDDVAVPVAGVTAAERGLDPLHPPSVRPSTDIPTQSTDTRSIAFPMAED